MKHAYLRYSLFNTYEVYDIKQQYVRNPKEIRSMFQEDEGFKNELLY